MLDVITCVMETSQLEQIMQQHLAALVEQHPCCPNAGQLDVGHGDSSLMVRCVSSASMCSVG
jgi:hypothetical protein